MLPGVFRLRLPLPWPGVPHCNAWAVAAGDGVVLFDTGMHQPGSLAHLERAMQMCGLTIEDVRLVVCTHAHSDHYGQAATIVQRTGCELWMHPNHEHMKLLAEDPDAALERRLEVARQSGVPEEPLRRYAAERGGRESGIAAVIEPDRELRGGRDGIIVETDLGPWTVLRDARPRALARLPVPARAPPVDLRRPPARAHLPVLRLRLLARPRRRVPAARSTWSRRCARVSACPATGARSPTSHAHIEGNRELVAEHLAKSPGRDRGGRARGGAPLTAFEILPRVHGPHLTPMTAQWLLTETLAMLRHLEVTGRARRIPGEPERWAA